MPFTQSRAVLGGGEEGGERQPRRQDSVTGGGGNKFWGGTRSLFMWIRKGHGAREIYSSVDQTNRVKTKNRKKVFSSKIFTNSGYCLKIARNS